MKPIGSLETDDYDLRKDIIMAVIAAEFSLTTYIYLWALTRQNHAI